MHARMGRITFSPDKADDVTRHVEESIVPSALQQAADNQRGTARDPLWLERTAAASSTLRAAPPTGCPPSLAPTTAPRPPTHSLL